MACDRCGIDSCRGSSEYPTQPSKGHVAYIGDMEYVVGENGDLFRGPWAHTPLDQRGYRSGMRWETSASRASDRMRYLYGVAQKFSTPVQRGTTKLGESTAMVPENISEVARSFFPGATKRALHEAAPAAPAAAPVVPEPEPLVESVATQAKRALAEIRPKFFIEATGEKLDPSLRARINADLEALGFGGRSYFSSISAAVRDAAIVLGRFGFEWDTVTDANLFLGDKGTRRLDIAKTNQQDHFSPTPVSNSTLFFQWTKMPTDRYEVIAYLS